MSKTVNKLSFAEILTYFLTGQYSFSCFAENRAARYSGNEIYPVHLNSFDADNSGNLYSNKINSGSSTNPGHPGSDPHLKSGIRLLCVEMPDHFSLNQNHPNPFSHKTFIIYQCSMTCFVSLKVYDIHWKEISTLVYGQQVPGTYQAEFDGSQLQEGVYFYRMDTENFSDTKKMFVEK